MRELRSESVERCKEAENATRRFLRSVSRIFVIGSVELAPVGKKGYALCLALTYKKG